MNSQIQNRKRSSVALLRLWLLCVLAWLRVWSSSAHATTPKEFLQTYCITCHGASEQNADRRFDDLSAMITTPEEIERWQEVVDMLNLGEMPPEGELQPGDAKRTAAIRAMTKLVRAAAGRLADAGGHTVLRRINNHEYRHTIGDLLSINTADWNPSEFFPAESTAGGFDNNGKELVTSSMLLEDYLLAAEEAIERATHFEPRPELRSYKQASPFYFQDRQHNHLPKLFQVDRFRFIPDVPYTDLYGRHYRGGHIGFEPLALKGVPHSGLYTVRVKAAAIDRNHPYGEVIDEFRNGDPLVLELVAVDRRGSVESEGSVSQQRTLALVELTSEQPKWFQWKVPLAKGFEPEVRFRNGPRKTKRLVRILTQKAADHPEVAPFARMDNGREKSHGLLQVYRGPKLRIWEIQVEGPHVEAWPPVGHQRLYGDLRPDELSRSAIRRRLNVFAETAFRRPLDEAELKPVIALVNRKLDDGVIPLKALQLGFQAILCSPGFLYLAEGEGPLDDYQLASRLSYFLWSSMPDRSLLDSAKAGTLSAPDELSRQVERMLSSPKSDRFVSNFIRLWLDVDSIGEMPVSRDFRVYYRDNLETAMRAETESFFRHVLDLNLPPAEFLTAEYSFLNRELALHYGIDGVQGNQMRKVSLKGAGRRGLTSQALFLTASANGVDTSPVVRGVYVLKKVLGDSPPPPPPDVPEIESDIRGAQSIRQQLEMHREVASCAECHRRIDPLGFALENYDAIGGWRDEYPNGIRIDSSGRLPSDETFEAPDEFQQLMAKRGPEFTRCLTEKLMEYALGRKLGFNDRPDLKRIGDQMRASNGGLKSLIRLVVLSDPFREN